MPLNAVKCRKNGIFDVYSANSRSKTAAVVSKWSVNYNLTLRHIHADIQVKQTLSYIILCRKMPSKCRQNESFKRFLDVTLSHSMTIIQKLLEKGYQSLGHTYIQVCKHDIVISSHKNAVKRRKVR